MRRLTASDEFIPTRQSLLVRLKNWQDQASWKDFSETYWRLIYSAARKAGLTDAEAQEVVQETVISVAKQTHTASDIALAAYGRRAARFMGRRDNTDVFFQWKTE